MVHEVIEGVQEQTDLEEIAYGVDCGDYPGDPASIVSVEAYDMSVADGPVNVTSSVLNGSASISGTVITTPSVEDLTPGKRYRIRIAYVANDSNTYEVYFDIDCVD